MPAILFSKASNTSVSAAFFKVILVSALLLFFSMELAAQQKQSRVPNKPATSKSTKKTTAQKPSVTKVAADTANWTSEERNTFIQTCQEQLTWGKDSALIYCTCMQMKVERIYPRAEEAGNIDMKKIEELAIECIGNLSVSFSWTEKERKDFMESCVQRAAATIGQSKAKGYCSCMMKKLEKEYPNVVEIGKISSETLEKWARECRGGK